MHDLTIITAIALYRQDVGFCDVVFNHMISVYCLTKEMNNVCLTQAIGFHCVHAF